MGHWEQIGVANRHRQMRRARMNPAHRRVRDAAGTAGIIAAALALWALTLAPFALSLLG